MIFQCISITANLRPASPRGEQCPARNLGARAGDEPENRLAVSLGARAAVDAWATIAK